MNSRRTWGACGVVLAAVMVLLAYRWWMRPPALEYDNLRYIQLLTTAVSARNPDWLDGVSRAVEERHESGEMSVEELASLREIIGIAEAGEWGRADEECYALAVAQLGRRRASPESGHGHVH